MHVMRRLLLATIVVACAAPAPEVGSHAATAADLAIAPDITFRCLTSLFWKPARDDKPFAFVRTSAGPAILVNDKLVTNHWEEDGDDHYFSWFNRSMMGGTEYVMHDGVPKRVTEWLNDEKHPMQVDAASDGTSRPRGTRALVSQRCVKASDIPAGNEADPFGGTPLHNVVFRRSELPYSTPRVQATCTGDRAIFEYPKAMVLRRDGTRYNVGLSYDVHIVNYPVKLEFEVTATPNEDVTFSIGEMEYVLRVLDDTHATLVGVGATPIKRSCTYEPHPNP